MYVKNTNFIKSYERWEVLERHDRPRPGRTRHRKSAESVFEKMKSIIFFIF